MLEVVLFGSLLAGAGISRADEPALSLSGNVQIHGERQLTTASDHNNLDLFWGRVNVGLDYKDSSFQSKIILRVFPDGFGFDPVTSVTFDTGSGAVSTKTEAQAKLQMPQGWVKYTWPALAVRVGRIELHDGPSESYGYYIDGGTSGKFYSRKPLSDHNALEFTGGEGGFASSLILAAADRNLNHGYLRVQEKYSHSSGITVSAGYRSNVFDAGHYPDDEILNRFDLYGSYQIAAGVLAFAEWATLERAGADNEMPVMAGIQFPVSKYLDLLSLETEILSNRKVAGEDKPVLLNLFARKKFLNRLNFDLDLYSDPTRSDFAAMGMGLRMTSAIK